MKVAIHLSPVFHLPLTLEDASLLRELASKHYDSVCKQSATPGHGGFIHGWAMSLEFAQPLQPGDEPTMAQATWREIDITLKVLEMRRVMLHNRPADLERADALDRHLTRCFHIWRAVRPDPIQVDTDTPHGINPGS